MVRRANLPGRVRFAQRDHHACLRAETVIERNIETVCRLFEGHIPFEVLPVDDGSRDGTAAAIRRAADLDPSHVHPVYVQVNAGKGNALKCGFAAARGSHILLLDADLDLAPTRVTTFFDIMAERQAAIVIGSKRHPDSVIDYPWHRRLASSVYYALVRLLVGLPVSDTQTGMKLFTREALGWAFDRMLVKTFAFDLEVLSIAHARGYTVAEAPVEIHFGEKVGCLSWTNVKQVMTDTLAIFYRLRILRYYRSVSRARAREAFAGLGRDRLPRPQPLPLRVPGCPRAPDLSPFRSPGLA